MAENKKKTSGGGDRSWPLIILAFWFFWPVGLLLLFGKLFAEDEKKPAQQAPPLQGTVSPGRAGADRASAPHRQTKAAKAVKKVTKSPKAKKANAWWLKIIGLAVLFFGMNAAIDGVSSTLWAMQNDWTSLWWLEDLFSGLALTAGGAAMLYSGFSMDRQLKRFSKYLLVLGDREVTVQQDESLFVDGMVPHSIWNRSDSAAKVFKLSTRRQERL